MALKLSEALAQNRSLYEILSTVASENLPPTVWNYYRSGSLDETAALEAIRSWESVRLIPRSFTSVETVSMKANLLGQEYNAPVGFAPSSLQRCAHPDGELAMAATATAAQLPFVVSSNAGYRFEEISHYAPHWWCQTYLTAKREDSLPMIEKAVNAGASALVLTVDAPSIGTKYDVGNNDWGQIDITWHRANYDGLATSQQRGEWAKDLRASEIEWLKTVSGLPIIVKGIMDGGSARVAERSGAEAVWVSNHGGRQLARSITTREALPKVKESVKVPVFVDGGLYSGLDVASALALGADVAFLGRMPLYALAAGGPECLNEATAIVLKELEETIHIAGLESWAQLKDIIA